MQSVDISDSALQAASNALQRGDPLSALNAASLYNGAHARAVRGIALAQLGEFDRAKRELASARNDFIQRGATIWATKTLAALAEIGFATRDIDIALHHLDATALRATGDLASADYIDIQRARLFALLGRVAEAHSLLAAVRSGPAAELALAETSVANGRFAQAARHAILAAASSNPLLAGEARRLSLELDRQSFTMLLSGNERRLSLVELESVSHLYVDTIRRRCGPLDLKQRPSQFELLVALSRGPVTVVSLFGRANESLQVRLRMEVSRLRRSTNLVIDPTKTGFCCANLGLLTSEVCDPLSLLADGEGWSPRAIAAVLGESVRTVERRIKQHPAIFAKGQGRARRYFTHQGWGATPTRLLLLARS